MTHCPHVWMEHYTFIGSISTNESMVIPSIASRYMVRWIRCTGQADGDGTDATSLLVVLLKYW